MRGLLPYAWLVAVLPAALPCAAQEYQDWTVQCDNVNHCEAVGYGPDRETARWIAVQVVRDAGPATPVQVTFLLAEDGPAKPVDVAVIVDDHPPLRIRANQPVPPTAAHELLSRMIDGRIGQASDTRQHWTLPLAGMKAALLRMDALQGRIGTGGALVARGGHPEASVPPAPAMPVLRAAPRATRIDDSVVGSALIAAIQAGEQEETGWYDLYRLADGRLFLLLESGRGSTSSFHDGWLANAQPPYQPRQLDLPTNGLPGDVLVNADFDGQVLSSVSGRTLADCGHGMKWLWTGRRFELLSLTHADHCRGMLDRVNHRKWIARMVP